MLLLGVCVYRRFYTLKTILAIVRYLGFTGRLPRHILDVAIQEAHQLGNSINTVHADGALTFDCGGLSLGLTLADLYEDVIGDQTLDQQQGQ